MNDQNQRELRPDPDALLAEVEYQQARQQRGKLKIFFGMSAGVGKTFAMLDEARKRAAEGLDVVVGYAEPHIRPDTEAMLVALDLLPYRLVDHHNAKLREFDLVAALARRPMICCVDELAHTNAAGSRHAKRWQDVAELLEAGISVYTTLNVQHLEGLNDLVERITGVHVRETLPDAVFDAADEVKLIDVAPDELLERFREGRVYKPEQAELASKHFFTKGNLIALREMALRRMAERVDEQMRAHRRDERLAQIVPASERVLVCVGPSPLSIRLIRSAKRLATGMRATLLAAAVENPEASPRSARERASIDRNLRLAETLGARAVTLTGRNVATEVVMYARTQNVTKIVVGKPDRPRWRDWIFGSIVDDLIRLSGAIDVYVIRGDEEDVDASRHPGPPTVDGVGKRPLAWPDHLAATAIVLFTTAVGWPLYHRLHVENVNILMLYLLGVLWVAARRSRGAAITTCVLSVLAFDATFVPPYYTLAISDRQYMLTFAVMLLTALVISTLTLRVRRQAEAARLRERRTAAVLQLSRDLSVARSAGQVADATARHVVDAVGGRVAVLLPEQDKVVRIASDIAGDRHDVRIDAHETSIAQWAFDHAKRAGRATDTLPASAGQYIPLMDSSGAVGVLAIYPPHGQDDWTADQRHLAQAMSLQAAVAMGRVMLNDEARTAWERVEAETLRNTLLSGVSHDLRTPLAGIIGAATTLKRSATHGPAVDAGTHGELIDTIVGEGERMNRLINNLLDMSRLEAGGLSLKLEWIPGAEIVGAALQGMQSRLAGRSVLVDVPRDLPLVRADSTAIEQVLTNLLDNAVEHTPAGSAIEISVRSSLDDHVTFEVGDHGPGLAPGTQRQVFDKFFRGQQDGRRGGVRRGAGLGLAICRALVEAHGGTVEAVNRIEGGALFRFTLPFGDAPPPPAIGEPNA